MNYILLKLDYPLELSNLTIRGSVNLEVIPNGPSYSSLTSNNTYIAYGTLKLKVQGVFQDVTNYGNLTLTQPSVVNGDFRMKMMNSSLKIEGTEANFNGMDNYFYNSYFANSTINVNGNSLFVYLDAGSSSNVSVVNTVLQRDNTFYNLLVKGSLTNTGSTIILSSINSLDSTVGINIINSYLEISGSGSNIQNIIAEGINTFIKFSLANQVSIGNISMQSLISTIIFDNCQDVAIGTPQSNNNTIGDVRLAGTTSISFLGVNNLRNVNVVSSMLSSDKNFTQILIKVVNGKTQVVPTRYNPYDWDLYNTTVLIENNSNLTLYGAGSSIYLHGSSGIIVNNGSVLDVEGAWDASGFFNRGDQITLDFNQSTTQLRLMEGSTFISKYSNIIGSVMLVNNVMFQTGDVVINGTLYQSSNTTINTQGGLIATNYIQEGTAIHNVIITYSYTGPYIQTNYTQLNGGGGGSQFNVYFDNVLYPPSAKNSDFILISSLADIIYNPSSPQPEISLIKVNNRKEYGDSVKFSSLSTKIIRTSCSITIQLRDKSLSAWKIALIVIGSVIGVVLIIAAIVIINKRLQRKSYSSL
eukprot:gene5906-7355_t